MIPADTTSNPQIPLLGNVGVKLPTQPVPPAKSKAKPNKTMKQAMRIMTANRQLPALPKQSTAFKANQEERLSDPDDNDTSGHQIAAAPRVPTSQRIAHVPLKPSVQTPSQREEIKTPTIPKPPRVKPFKEPKKVGRPPGKRADPSPPVQAIPGSARERIQAAGLGPQVVEQNLVRHTLGKLNPAQMEAAKRRANIATQPFLPSKDGFRMSAHEVKAKDVGKMEARSGGDEEEFFCPSRHSTAPTRVATASGDHKDLTAEKVKVQSPDSNSRSKSLDRSFEEAAKAEEVPKVITKPGNAVDGSQKEGERTLSTESLDDDLNLSDSDGEEGESVIRPKKEINKKGEIKKVGPVVETIEEDNYDALDFDLSESDEEHMEVDNNHDDEVVRKEASAAVVKLKEEDRNSVTDMGQSSSPFDGSGANFTENNLGLSGYLPGSPKDGIALPKKSKRKKEKTFGSLLESLDHGWKMRNAENMANLKNEREKLSKERQGFAYEAHTDGLRKHFKNLMGSQNEESFGRLVDSIAATRSLPGCCNMVCDLAYQQLVGEHKDTPLLSEAGQDQPEMTRRQQRLFTLLVSLQARPGFTGVMARMVTLLRHALFGRERMFHLRVNAVQNIGRMFVLCSRYLNDLQGIRHCLFDLFYFKSPRNHLLLGIVMALWPDALPLASDPLAKTPLMETLVWCVFNTGPAQKAPEMKVQEVKDDFARNYGYKQNLWKADDLVKKYIAVAAEDPSEADMKEVKCHVF